jgi:hypothetical protein
LKQFRWRQEEIPAFFLLTRFSIGAAGFPAPILRFLHLNLTYAPTAQAGKIFIFVDFLCMRRILLSLSVLLIFKATAGDLLVENLYSRSFQKAYSLYPSIPKGMLEAVAYTQTRFQHLKGNTPESCMGLPRAYSVMGLVADGKNYFRNNLLLVSELSGYTEAAIKSSAESSILAYAKAFHALQQQKNIFSPDPADYISVLKDLSEIPVDNNLQNDFAMSAHLYQVFWFLNNSEMQDVYGFPDHRIDLPKIFGDNYKVLSAKSVVITPEGVNGGNANYKFTNNNIVFSPDYPSAIYTPAAACNYSSRNGTAISAVTIHDIEGTYASCISWFQNCNAQVSAHYVLRSSDGQVTQMVLESAKAWHVGTENPYTIGLEHEGYNNTPSWYTNAMYGSSALLVKDICTDNNINPLRTYYGPGCSGSSQQCGLGACTKVKGHQMYPNQTHNDPGPYWDWAKYYKLINNTYSITATYTANTGSFYDTGGPAGNYSDDERKFWLFAKPGVSNITLSFSAFNVENGYDNLFIYNGGSVNSPLVGQYTGTVNPGPVTSSNDSVLVEFRSDCATNASGWAATYVMNGTVNPGPGDNIAPTTQVNTNNAWKTAAFTSTITDIDNIGGSGIQKGYYQVIDFNGAEWRANYTKGFFADNFDNAINAEWTVKTGSWSVQGNALVQSDEVSLAAGNTNIYAALTQSLSNRYLYHFLAKFEGTGASRRAGFHFFCDQPDSSNRNNSYFVWFRLDDQKVQIYKVVNNNFGSPKVDLPLTFNASQWYDIKTIYDRVTGVITVYWNNSAIATWTDNAPYSNGDYISFRSGNCKFSVDEIKVYRSRANLVNVNVGNGMANELRYENTNPLTIAGKIKSICQDSAGNLSAITYYDLNVDWTPPANLTFVNDGKGADISMETQNDSISANWSASSDPNSAIARYWYSIGTAPGSTNTVGWTSNWGATAVTVKSLNLANGITYYFNVKAENGAGLFSNVISSNGQLVDTLATSVNEIINDSYLQVFPNPFTSQISFKLYNSQAGKVKITLTDISGRVVYASETKEETGWLEGNFFTGNLNLSKGAYFLTVSMGGKNYRKKLLKE